MRLEFGGRWNREHHIDCGINEHPCILVGTKDLDFDKMSFKVNDTTRASISSNHLHGPAVGFADGKRFPP